jgi:hypothetical protein
MAGPSVSDPCSFYSTKILDLDLQIRRWYDDWGDLLSVREDAKDSANNLRSGIGTAEAEIARLVEAAGTDQATLSTMREHLAKLQDDLIYADRAFNLANDRLRHYDREVPHLLRDRTDMEARLRECEDRARSSGPQPTSDASSQSGNTPVGALPVSAGGAAEVSEDASVAGGVPDGPEEEAASAEVPETQAESGSTEQAPSDGKHNCGPAPCWCTETHSAEGICSECGEPWSAKWHWHGRHASPRCVVGG